jgi:hypothetical protein
MFSGKKSVIFCMAVIAICLSRQMVSAQPEQRYNRFQYHKSKWQILPNKAFRIYFPKGHDSAAALVARELPMAIKRVKHNMGTGLLKAPNVIIYPSPDQRYESNIGLFEQDQHAVPTFITKGNRIVVTYNGSCETLKEELYEAVARAIWEAQVNESIVDKAKGSAMKEDIPFWFKEGAIRFFAHKWPIQAEDALRRSYEQNNFTNWQQCIAYQPRLSGQAFCYYLTENCYPHAVLQLYQQLKKKNLQRSLRLVTKQSVDSLFIKCHQFYQSRFSSEPSNQTVYDSLIIQKKKGVLRNMLFSPDQQYVAYTTTRNNKRTVWACDIKSATTKKLTSYALAPWLNDHTLDPYPLMQWQDDGTLSVMMPVEGKMNIKHFNGRGTSLGKDIMLGIDGVSSFQPLNSEKYLLAAYRKAQSDIVAYDAIEQKYVPHTSDAAADANPTINSSGQIVFISKRADSLKSPLDTPVYREGLYKINNGKVQPIITDTSLLVKWDKPQFISGNRLLATHTAYGMERFFLFGNNQQLGQYTTLSTYKPFQYLASTNQIAFHNPRGKSIQIVKQPLEKWIEQNSTDNTSSPWLEDYNRRRAEEAKFDSMLKVAQEDGPSFLEGILMPANAKERAKRREDSIINAQLYHPKKVKPYILQLHSAYFSARINNDYFINRYQPYLNYQGQFKFPEVSGMVQGGFTDLFENHHISVAYRLPVSTEGSDFFVRYENKAKKWDWGGAYFRKVEQLSPDPKRRWTNESGKLYPNQAKVKTHYYELSARYPLTYELSVGIQTAIRQDRTIFLATEKYSLTFEDIKSIWSINTLSLNLNKLDPTLPLLYKGLKGRGLIDVFKGFSQEEHAVLGSTIRLEYHQPILKYITVVALAQAGYSAGQRKVLYNLGQVDNTVTPRIDSNVHFSQNAPYAFQTLATPLRGHLQNQMYGDRFMLLNTDVYFPIFQTLIPLETPLQFVNLLQLGLFTDVATAKEGWNETAPLKGWLWSYGFSARSTLASYPIRFDIAWPGTFDKNPVWYLSLTLK